MTPTPESGVNPAQWLIGKAERANGQFHDKLTRADLSPHPLPDQAPAPAPVEGGTHTVQLLRTYPNLRHGRDYPFARGGERSVARGYGKALDRARRLVSIEDQYLWSLDVARAFDDALRASPDLRVVAVLPPVPVRPSPCPGCRNAAAADRLDAWHAGDQVGPRPPGRLRRLQPPRLGPFPRLWARPVARFVHDPDGRPAGLRRARRF